jgi:hypothetical protein
MLPFSCCHCAAYVLQTQSSLSIPTKQKCTMFVATQTQARTIINSVPLPGRRLRTLRAGSMIGQDTHSKSFHFATLQQLDVLKTTSSRRLGRAAAAYKYPLCFNTDSAASFCSFTGFDIVISIIFLPCSSTSVGSRPNARSEVNTSI